MKVVIMNMWMIKRVNMAMIMMVVIKMRGTKVVVIKVIVMVVKNEDWGN